MYLRLLDETVNELKGVEMPLEIHSTLNLGLDIRIPPDYIADENQRLRAYKRIADAHDAESGNQILAELADRYGPPPEAVETLLRFAQIKTEAERAGIEAIDRRSGSLQIKFHPGSKIDPARLMALLHSRDGAQFTPAGVLRLPLPVNQDGAGAVLNYLKESIEMLA
jgi:transcription-repair coupling factor (superfamily II helicase)